MSVIVAHTINELRLAGRDSDIFVEMTEVTQRVKEIIAEVWRESSPDAGTWREIQDDVPLYPRDAEEESLGLDSLDALEIAMLIEEAFDVVLPTEIEPDDIRTVGQVVDLLARVLKEQREEA